MSRMLPVDGTSPFVVTTDDGTLFHCQPHEIEAEGSVREPRWILIDTQHVPHVGPVYDGQVPPQALQRLLNAWWAERAEA